MSVSRAAALLGNFLPYFPVEKAPPSKKGCSGVPLAHTHVKSKIRPRPKKLSPGTQRILQSVKLSLTFHRKTGNKLFGGGGSDDGFCTAVCQSESAPLYFAFSALLKQKAAKNSTPDCEMCLFGNHVFYRLLRCWQTLFTVARGWLVF